jgi:hypothetical protein
MKGINEFTAEQIKHWNCVRETVDGWKLARPIGRGGIIRRLKKAWKVFTGQADVLIWHKQ